MVLVLRGQALAAWRRGGQQWKAWSSRCMSVVLQVDKRTVVRIHVVSCYALTRAAHREDKDAFFQELKNIISGVLSGETYIILGDFNARVGSRESIDDEWSNVRGPYGFGSVNDAGKELLSFLSIHQVTMCNMWYQKKDIHRQIWQHPKSKQWSCMDFAVMKQRDWERCIDVTAKRGAECNTDHNLICMKL